jgi:hypothetical protein
VIASAYRYARGGEIPGDLELLRMVDRFGAQAVFGRILKRSEMRRMVLVERIVTAYQAMKSSEDVDGWIKDHPEDWKLLDYAAGCE